MNIPKISALFETSLASALSAAGTSFTLVSATDRDGNALSGLYPFIIDEGSADEEFFIVTVSGTTATVVYRGIDADAPNTEVSANKKAHRRGASVKITDYPIMGVLRNILNGDESLPNPLKYAAGIGPVSADDLVDKAYADALVGGGTLSYDRIIVAGKAGETIASGQLVYLKASDNRWWLCDADTAATVDNAQLGIAQGAGTAGNTISGGVLVYGVASNLTGLTADTKYYASNTAGALSTSAGTTEVTIGLSISTTSLFFAPRYDQQITEDLQDALAGKEGTPSASNTFVTDDYIRYNSSSGATDQSQTTQNATAEVGEANATSKKNKLAQSFVAGKKRISGVKLYKAADTGTFTGTVTIALQADSAGAPSGSNLASVTISNAAWAATSAGAFTALFSTEYTTMTVGSTYWIVISTSTSDNSNHPNVGTNSAGGYASGSAKYNNSTDGWVAISPIDLYFETLEGIVSQLAKTGTDGLIPTLINPGILAQTTTSVSITDGSSSAETTLFSRRILASRLSTNNILRGRIYISNFGIAATSTFTLRLKYGATTVATVSFDPTTAAAVSSLQGWIEFYLIANGATNAQIGALTMFLTNSDAEVLNDATVFITKAQGAANGTATEDSTVDKALTVTAQYSAANAANDLTALFGFVELIRQ